MVGKRPNFEIMFLRIMLFDKIFGAGYPILSLFLDGQVKILSPELSRGWKTSKLPFLSWPT